MFNNIVRNLKELSGDESGIEEEELVDNSDEDSDYIVNDQNILMTEGKISEVIRNVENSPIPPKESRKRKHNSTCKTDNISKSKKDNKGGQIERECDDNRFIG